MEPTRCKNNKCQSCYLIYMVTGSFDEDSLEVVFVDLKQRYKFWFTQLLLKYNTIILTTLLLYYKMLFSVY